MPIDVIKKTVRIMMLLFHYLSVSFPLLVSRAFFVWTSWQRPLLDYFNFQLIFQFCFAEHTFIALHLSRALSRALSSAHFIILIFDVVSKMNINKDLVNISNDCLRATFIFYHLLICIYHSVLHLRWDNFIAIYWLTFLIAINFIARNPQKLGFGRRRNGICFWAF